jgi:hypothetical protein
VKIRIETGSAHAVKPDFGMLREGFRVAQRTTPTAQASDKARVPQDHAEALIRMFAGPKAAQRKPAKGSFYPTLPPVDDDKSEL